MNLKEIGQFIRDARIKKKLSVDEVGEKCQVSTTGLVNLEKGHQLCSLHLFLAILKCLKISKDDQKKCVTAFFIEKQAIIIKRAPLKLTAKKFAAIVTQAANALLD